MKKVKEMFNKIRIVLRLALGVLLFAGMFGTRIVQAQGIDTIALLLPDNTPITDTRVTAWLDAGQEEGLRLQVIYDSQFMQLGSGALQYRGIILPDQLHARASDALVTAIKNYVTQGGRAMLIFDFGALTSTGFYSIPKSRFSSLAGVDYVLYDELRERTVGLGPVTGLESSLRQIQIPPGKSMPYTATSSTASTLSTSNNMLASAKSASGQALYLPVSPNDPGGMKGFDAAQFHNIKIENLAAQNKNPRSQQKIPTLNFGAAQKGVKVNNISPANLTTMTGTAAATSSRAAATNDPLHAISGYIFGILTYPSYVTRGTFAGSTLATAPDFGLVAGVNQVGNGQVLFVNLPLTYLKVETDGMPMHGFLHYFSNDMLKFARLSSMPQGRGGLTLNWHLDSNDALQPMQTLKDQGVWNDGPFSIHMTAGPDDINIGDGLGFNLSNNPTAQQFLKDFDAQGHQVGSHGGWDHDYYGTNASETNQSEFQQYLVLNKNAIESVLGHSIAEYSAPEGNNPTWAVNWLDQNGFVGYYFGGHTGLGPTRTYRDGTLMNPKLWAFPVTPFGQYATFEEFESFNVNKQDVIDWYKALIDFSIKNCTDRLIYMHPPGAVVWPDVVQALLDYAKQNRQAGQFRWYTMQNLSSFMTRRKKVAWTETLASNGTKQFQASHPNNLANMTWLLPKSAFAKPIITTGAASVVDGTNNWLVVAGAGTTLKFTSVPL